MREKKRQSLYAHNYQKIVHLVRTKPFFNQLGGMAFPFKGKAKSPLTSYPSAQVHTFPARNQLHKLVNLLIEQGSTVSQNNRFHSMQLETTKQLWTIFFILYAAKKQSL